MKKDDFGQRLIAMSFLVIATLSPNIDSQPVAHCSSLFLL